MRSACPKDRFLFLCEFLSLLFLQLGNSIVRLVLPLVAEALVEHERQDVVLVVLPAVLPRRMLAAPQGCASSCCCVSFIRQLVVRFPMYFPSIQNENLAPPSNSQLSLQTYIRNQHRVSKSTCTHKRWNPRNYYSSVILRLQDLPGSARRAFQCLYSSRRTGT